MPETRFTRWLSEITYEIKKTPKEQLFSQEMIENLHILVKIIQKRYDFKLKDLIMYHHLRVKPYADHQSVWINCQKLHYYSMCLKNLKKTSKEFIKNLKLLVIKASSIILLVETINAVADKLNKDPFHVKFKKNEKKESMETNFFDGFLERALFSEKKELEPSTDERKYYTPRLAIEDLDEID